MNSIRSDVHVHSTGIDFDYNCNQGEQNFYLAEPIEFQPRSPVSNLTTRQTRIEVESVQIIIFHNVRDSHTTNVFIKLMLLEY